MQVMLTDVRLGNKMHDAHMIEVLVFLQPWLVTNTSNAIDPNNILINLDRYTSSTFMSISNFTVLDRGINLFDSKWEQTKPTQTKVNPVNPFTKDLIGLITWYNGLIFRTMGLI